ncbi:hypothetical protein BDW59DRAFT_181878 [Aspergillus cavernicola]|uniref:LITAF domain-containing protein n=1 Tax=Aspergillus cavernicola TaxID=176166 RepID=A0ABR4HTM5_9EURO
MTIFSMGPKPDAAPPYEELSDQPRNSYFSVPQNDIHDEEQAQPQEAQPEQPQHQHAYLNTASCRSNPLPPPSTFQPHVHCKTCDGFLERQQRVRTDRFNCAMASVTLMVAFICAMSLGIVMANAN